MSIARCLLSSWSLFNLTCSKGWAKWSHVMFLDCQDWQAYHKFCTINLAKSIAREAWNCAHPRYSWHSRSGTKSSKFEQFARWDHAPLCIAFLSSNACSSWRHTPRWTRWKEIGLTHRGSRIAAQKKAACAQARCQAFSTWANEPKNKEQIVLIQHQLLKWFWPVSRPPTVKSWHMKLIRRKGPQGPDVEFLQIAVCALRHLDRPLLDDSDVASQSVGRG